MCPVYGGQKIPHESDDQRNLDLAVAMFPRISNHPCVNLHAFKRVVHVCRSIHSLRSEEGVIWGTCDWEDVHEDRIPELTDGLAIGCDQLEVGETWWFDMYFGWFFIFDRRLVDLSQNRDTTWVPSFLERTTLQRTDIRNYLHANWPWPP